MYRIIVNKSINSKYSKYYYGGLKMIYSDVSCNVKNTLKKLINLDFDKIIKSDYFALITITRYGRILIDGDINYSNVDSSVLAKLLQGKRKELYILEEGKIYSFNENGKKLDIIVVPLRMQDNYKVFSICCSLDKDYTERDLSIMKFVTKVTYENVLLDNEVIKERNYLQNLFDSVDSFVIGIDIDGKITSANRGTFGMFGLEPDKIVGRSYSDFITEENNIKIQNTIAKVINKNKSYSGKEEIFSNLNHEKIYVNLTISPINNNKEEVVGVVIIGRDVTKQKIYEREIEQIKQFALLGELAAGLAHDIKNPLMSIRGCARILEKKLSKDYKCKEFIEPIIYEVDRIDEKIKQMLSYSFITQEELYSLLDINEVLEKCFNVVSFHKESKYINIERKFSKNLPLIRGNNVQLQQAFINILFNAVQAIEVEGTIYIESHNVEKEKKVLVIISDDGKGISDDEMNRIFKPFYSTKGSGTGLGLSIVKRVIEKCGGQIIVNSKLDEGTEFKVYLPY